MAMLLWKQYLQLSGLYDTLKERDPTDGDEEDFDMYEELERVSEQSVFGAWMD